MEHTSSLHDQNPDEGLFTQGAIPENMSSDKAVDNHSEKSSLAFRTISEVATEIDVPQHVLRFWESRFTQLKPLKRGGGRRYYRPEDIELLRRIKNLLYKQGYTIKGVQRLLKESRTVAHAQMREPQMQSQKTAPVEKVHGQKSPAQKSFVPYAHAMASMPAYPLQPVMMNRAALLHAAAAAPSAMAMAYGVVSGTIQKESQQVREFEQKAERFADAFSGATTHISNEAENPDLSRMEQSLDAVTQIRDEIAGNVAPLRVDTNAAALEEAMQFLKHSDAASETEFEFVQEETVETDEVPARELTAEEEMPAGMMVQSASMLPLTLEEPVAAQEAPLLTPQVAAPVYPLQELKALLGDLLNLRAMLDTALAA